MAKGNSNQPVLQFSRRGSLFVCVLGLLVVWSLGGWVLFLNFRCSEQQNAIRIMQPGAQNVRNTFPTDGNVLYVSNPSDASRDNKSLDVKRTQESAIVPVLEKDQEFLASEKVKTPSERPGVIEELDLDRKSNEKVKTPSARPEATEELHLDKTHVGEDKNKPNATQQEDVPIQKSEDRQEKDFDEPLLQHAVDVPELGTDLVQYVDILRGAHVYSWSSLSRGNVLPIMARPFGMAHWAVVTTSSSPWSFNKNTKDFAGIRCTHQPSPWIGDYGFFDVNPLGGGIATYDKDSSRINVDYLETSIQNRGCRPGNCKKVGIEFSGTDHGGIFVFKYADTSDENEIGLSRLSSVHGRAHKDRHRFVFDGISQATSVFNMPHHVKTYVSGSIEMPGGLKEIAVVQGQLKWKGGGTVILRIGTSFISHSQATLNRDRELEKFSIDQVKRASKKVWNDLLNRVQVTLEDDATESEVVSLKKDLYSCLYRALLFPRQLGETNSEGKIVHWSAYGRDGGVFGGPLSTDSGFWDSYRAVYPMLHLVFPDLVETALEGWVNAIREEPNNVLVQWASPGRVGSMVGSMGEISLAEGIVNNALSKESVTVAFNYMKKSAFTKLPNGRDRIKEYIATGYVPKTNEYQEEGTVGLSLNYMLTDFSVAQAATSLGDIDSASRLTKRSLNWKKLFDPKTKFFRPKDAAGHFPKRAFDQYMWMGEYTEGGPWQYRFYVPHDVKGLRDAYQGGQLLRGGVSVLCEKLKDMMTHPSTVSNRNRIHEEEEMIRHSFGQYAHNNQPVHHVLYMFADAGCPLEGQKWIHHTLRTQYGTFGFAGDEDNGEQSSWYILSSFGLYALVPGSGKYQVGAPPLFKQVVINRPKVTPLGRKGGPLTISRTFRIDKDPLKKFTPATTVSWGGKTFDISQSATNIPYTELLAGGHLQFNA
mmetsp:Transcript_3089/g.4416  ORF Transcript_3089/g.4416 Transcript_3089/m.4416 type:complete len:930 (+) Transcript_3089:390-3179(+)